MTTVIVNTDSAVVQIPVKLIRSAKAGKVMKIVPSKPDARFMTTEASKDRFKLKPKYQCKTAASMIKVSGIVHQFVNLE